MAYAIEVLHSLVQALMVALESFRGDEELRAARLEKKYEGKKFSLLEDLKPHFYEPLLAGLILMTLEKLFTGSVVWTPVLSVISLTLLFSYHQRWSQQRLEFTRVVAMEHALMQFSRFTPLTRPESAEWMNKALLDLWPSYIEPLMVMNLLPMFQEMLDSQSEYHLTFTRFTFGTGPPLLTSVQSFSNNEAGSTEMLEMSLKWATEDANIEIDAKLMGISLTVGVTQVLLEGTLQMWPVWDERIILYAFKTTPKIDLTLNLKSMVGTVNIGKFDFLKKMVQQVITDTYVAPVRSVFGLDTVVKPEGWPACGEVNVKVLGVLHGPVRGGHYAKVECEGVLHRSNVFELFESSSKGQEEMPWTYDTTCQLSSGYGVLKLSLHSAETRKPVGTIDLLVMHLSDGSTAVWAAVENGLPYAKRWSGRMPLQIALPLTALRPSGAAACNKAERSTAAAAKTVRAKATNGIAVKQEALDLTMEYQPHAAGRKHDERIRNVLKTGAEQLSKDIAHCDDVIAHNRDALYRPLESEPRWKVDILRSRAKTTAPESAEYQSGVQARLGAGVLFMEDDYSDDARFTAQRSNSNMQRSYVASTDTSQSKQGAQKPYTHSLMKLSDSMVDSMWMLVSLEKVRWTYPQPDKEEEIKCEYRTAGPRTIVVQILSASDLAGKDKGGTRSDPFVKFKFNKRTYRTGTVLKTLHPVWKETFLLREPVDAAAGALLKFEVWDEDRGIADNDFIGDCRLPLGAVKEGTVSEFNLHLSGEDTGSLSVLISIVPGFPEGNPAVEEQLEKQLNRAEELLSTSADGAPVLDPGTPKGLVPEGQETWELSITEGRHIPEMDMNGADPMVHIYIGKKHIDQTKVCRGQLNPQWNFRKVVNVTKAVAKKDADLKLKVFDHDRLSRNDYIGSVSIPYEQIVSKRFIADWFDVEGAVVDKWRSKQANKGLDARPPQLRVQLVRQTNKKDDLKKKARQSPGQNLLPLRRGANGIEVSAASAPALSANKKMGDALMDALDDIDLPGGVADCGAGLDLPSAASITQSEAMAVAAGRKSSESKGFAHRIKHALNRKGKKKTSTSAVSEESELSDLLASTQKALLEERKLRHLHSAALSRMRKQQDELLSRIGTLETLQDPPHNSDANDDKAHRSSKSDAGVADVEDDDNTGTTAGAAGEKRLARIDQTVDAGRKIPADL